MRGGDFVYDSIDASYYDLNKVSLSRGGSYIYSLNWLQDKKATINPKNKGDRCFQHPLTVALNYGKIKDHPERISKIKPFIDKYNWKEIDFPSHLSQTINQLLLTFCICLIILKKSDMHISQNII